MTDLTLATWFHADSADRPGTYAQALGDASDAGHYEIYLRCVDVFVASSRRWNPLTPLLVVLNEEAVSTVSRARSAFWARCGAEQVTTANTHIPKTDLYQRWQNQFFLFDVIDACLPSVADGGGLAVLDSDVVVRGSVEPLAERVAGAGRVSMTVGYSEDADIHGITRVQLGALHQDWGGSDTGFVPEYLGGEFVAGTPAALTALREASESVYRWSLDEQAASRRHPTEEAHIISMALPVRSSEVNGNDLVERLWTQPWKFRSVSATAAQKPLWHLPAEKRTGIRLLHRAAVQPTSWFWTASDTAWRARAARLLGVPRYTPGKAISDLGLLGTDAIRRRRSAR